MDPPTSAATNETADSGVGRRSRNDTEYENTSSVSQPTRVVPTTTRKAVNSDRESSRPLSEAVIAVDAAKVTVNSATKAKTLRDLRVVLLGFASNAIP
ncbi:hypothetical protein SAMN05428985_102531 [Nocardioides sp. YR527]|nr:hypothetical protein SAMN05428985_102531 [Nocardioides sp. YR527]